MTSSADFRQLLISAITCRACAHDLSVPTVAFGHCAAQGMERIPLQKENNALTSTLEKRSPFYAITDERSIEISLNINISRVTRVLNYDKLLISRCRSAGCRH